MGPPRRQFSSFRLITALLAILVAGCLGNDFRSAPLDVEKVDSGWLLAIEPGEEFSVGLLGSFAYPSQQWSVADFDDAVLRLSGAEHEEPREPSEDAEAVEEGESDPGSLLTLSRFVFEGVALGETQLRFELIANGQLIDVAEYAVQVVDDACDADTSAVANRCGGEGFGYHPQVLNELSYGEDTVLEEGASIGLVLHANQAHPDASWAITGYDAGVVAVAGPIALTPRPPSDFSEVDVGIRHSFIPASEFTITGLAQGTTTLTLELASDGQLLDEYETTLVVESE